MKKGIGKETGWVCPLCLRLCQAKEQYCPCQRKKGGEKNDKI